MYNELYASLLFFDGDCFNIFLSSNDIEFPHLGALIMVKKNKKIQ